MKILILSLLVGGIVMMPGVGEYEAAGLMNENLPAMIFGASGFVVLAATVFVSRKNARWSPCQKVPPP